MRIALKRLFYCKWYRLPREIVQNRRYSIFGLAADGLGWHYGNSMLEAACQAVRGASRIAVLTGAGVSAESGIPTFRSNGGFWQTNRFQDLATPEAFARNPQVVWEWYE